MSTGDRRLGHSARLVRQQRLGHGPFEIRLIKRTISASFFRRLNQRFSRIRDSIPGRDLQPAGATSGPTMTFKPMQMSQRRFRMRIAAQGHVRSSMSVAGEVVVFL
jgi:hypothetical protein